MRACLALDGLRADAVKWEAIGSSNQQSAIGESLTATDAKSAKEKHLNKVFFLLLPSSSRPSRPLRLKRGFG
jgi:hypothetical protein